MLRPQTTAVVLNLQQELFKEAILQPNFIRDNGSERMALETEALENCQVAEMNILPRRKNKPLDFTMVLKNPTGDVYLIIFTTHQPFPTNLSYMRLVDLTNRALLDFRFNHLPPDVTEYDNISSMPTVLPFIINLNEKLNLDKNLIVEQDYIAMMPTLNFTTINSSIQNDIEIENPDNLLTHILLSLGTAPNYHTFMYQVVVLLDIVPPIIKSQLVKILEKHTPQSILDDINNPNTQEYLANLKINQQLNDSFDEYDDNNVDDTIFDLINYIKGKFQAQ
ncbi:MAG: hypothetical protein ATN36_00365 [Epulopiscium sp. Nele67-Bin005]|nr:MAG: hypothetical protein ATN36_00365 [Epulopiscium sp. Nele67-Bin005]